MALNAVRIATAKMLVSPYPRLLQPTMLKRICPTQVAFISGKALRDKDYMRPAPFPYKEKNYTVLRGLFDRTTHRLDENSKIVVVEGPVACGKAAFCKELAEDLDMLYLPAVTMDNFYINAYNYDLRKLDPHLPESCRSYDVKNFWQDPNHVNAANFQIQMFILRLSQYIDALAHLLSTGQGVVLDRCIYSDFVFAEAMFKSKFISKGALGAYYEIRENTLSQILKPHLVIYLDVSVATTLENIKKRGIPEEVKSKVFTPQYLECIEENYKQKHLPSISTHAELLVYDWSSHGEVEVVVEDIERIDFDRFDKDDPKMEDWRLKKEWDWAEVRMKYANDKNQVMACCNVPVLNVPELLIDGHDAWQRRMYYEDAPGNKFTKGYNTDMGDSGTLLRSSIHKTQ